MNDMMRQRRDVTSALYYLVWHAGVTLSAAEWYLEQGPDRVAPLAELGRVEGRKAFNGLHGLILAVENKPNPSAPAAS